MNLEENISTWRQQMLAAGIKDSSPLDELEGHLREDIERHMDAGQDAQQAFESAARNLGHGQTLKEEFVKAGEPVRFGQFILRLVGFSFVAFIVALSGFTFWYVQLSPWQKVAAAFAVGANLLVGLGWRRAIPHLPAFSSPRATQAVGLAVIALGFMVTGFYCQVILPHVAREFGDSRLVGDALPALVTVLPWAAFPIAVGFGLACGIQEAGRRRTSGTAS